MKYLLILLTVSAFAFDYPIAINGHTINLFDSKPATVTDLSDEGNDGTVYGATMTDDGMSFNGVDDYIDVGDIDIYDFHDVNFSLATWVKTDKNGYFIQKAENAGHYYGWRFYINSQGLLDCLTVSPVKHAIGTSIVTNDTWTFAVFTLSNGVGRIYCNGALEGTTTEMNPTDKSLPLILGRTSENTAYFEGNLHNTAIYRDKALTPSEITTLYNAGCNASKDVISTNGLVLFYDFDAPERTLTLQEKTFFYKDMLVWYPFIEGGEDAGPNGYNATIPVEWDYSNKVYTTDNAHYSTMGTINLVKDKTEITVSGWYKIHAYTNTTSNMASLIGEWKDWWASSSMDNFTVGFDSRNGRVKAKIWPAVNKIEILGTTTVPLDTWAFVTMVYDGLTLKIYLNGILENTATAELGAFDNSTYPLRLGYNNYCRLDADIRDIRAYNKALTDEKVLTLYNGTK